MSFSKQYLGNRDRARRSSTYEARIRSLKASNKETSHIEKGINEINDVLKRGAKSFVVYGEPQSGKTEVMIALTCSLIDAGFRTIFIIMNDNVQLEDQNFLRFCNVNELNPSPMTDSAIALEDEAVLKKDIPRVIFCRKNSTRLENVITACRFMGKRVVIDDEADYASPNAKINKQDQTKINERVEQLIDRNDGGIYIGVTATPGRLDLNNTFLNKSDDWVFIDPYPGYKGQAFFFPTTKKRAQTSDYILTKLPEAGEAREQMVRVIHRYLIRVALLNRGKSPNEYDKFSMLIHTGGKKDDHKKDKQIVDSVVGKIQGITENLISSEEAEKTIDKLEKEINYVIPGATVETKHDIIDFILRFIGKKEILVVNSDKNENAKYVERACNPTSIFTFAIGGNIVSRGLTFNNLLTFFFSRTVKGKLQQNTYIQRARMFGNRDYTKHFELAIPGSLFEEWADAFSDHEESVLSAKAGNYIHFQSKRSSAADSASIDKANVEMWKGSDIKTCDVFNYTQSVADKMISGRNLPLKTLESLVSTGLVPIPKAFIEHAKSLVDNDESLCHILLEDDIRLYNIVLPNGSLRYKDANEAQILRENGGLMSGITKEAKYDKFKILILPMINNNGQMRIYSQLKKETGKNILINVLDRNNQ